jgi:hypothetical protein
MTLPTDTNATRRSWATIVLGLVALGYGALFLASLLTTIYSYAGTGWVLDGLNRVWPAALAALAVGLIVALQRRQRGWLVALFAVWFVVGILSGIAFHPTWGAMAIATGAIALLLCWPFLSSPNRPA